MSEAKEENPVEIVSSPKSIDQDISQSDATYAPVSEAATEEKNGLSGLTPPVLLLGFAVLALFVILMFSIISGNSRATKELTLDDPSVAALKADIEARRMVLNQQRIQSGLPPLEGSSEPMDEIAARLKNDADTLTSLSSRLQLLLTEKEAQINGAADELLRSQQIQQSLSTELSRLRQDYQEALISGSETAGLKLQLEDAIRQRQTISDELFVARQELANSQGAVSQAEYSDLEKRYGEAASARDFFENRVRELESQIGQAELFANSEEELLPAAVELFRRLRQLEGMKDSDLTTEYSKLGVDLGANVLHTLSFATGSSALTEQDQQRLQNVVAEIPEGDLALIIGYASTTGDPAANERLSSDRATAAAEYYTGMKRSEQLVQAVYLGQTDRFSSRIPERNQLCEVWRIRKK